MTDQNIVILSDVEHVLKRSGMYIGSTRIEDQSFWVFNTEDKKLEKKDVSYIPGLFKLFCEILDNALDEHIRGFGKKVDVIVDLDENTYSVKDYARGIPLTKHKEANVPTPQVVFTQLRAGSNFDDDDRTTVGMNGVGASLATVFAEKLMIEIARDGKVYRQAFLKNMSKIGSPDVRRKKQSYTGTMVTFTPDTSIFKEQIPMDLIYKRCMELSVAYPELEINLTVTENGETKKHKFVRDFESFIKLFGTDYKIVEDKKLGMKLAVCKNIHTESFEHFTNVNGADTFRGGTFVNHMSSVISGDFKDKIKKKHKLEVTNADINKQMILVHFQSWNAPQFEGQTKEKFVNDKKEVASHFDSYFTSRRLTGITSELPSIVEAVYDAVTLKNEKKDLAELRKAQRTVSKKKIPKLIEASGRDRMKCSLYITEGDSAISNLATIRNSKTMAGMPLRGKVLNVNGVSAKKILDNKEIQSLINAIGLKIGEKATPKSLNYGRIIIATDQDMDGYCIRMLLANFFHTYWPELFNDGRIFILETPLYEVIEKKGQTHYFYNKEEFETFMTGKRSTAYEISYFKGLGSCGKEAWDYMINEKPNLISVVLDDTSKEKLDLVFGSDSDARKEWLK